MKILTTWKLKVRRREDGKSTSNVNLVDPEHFLTAGPCSQACRDQ
jgi:hypothetical protein